MPLLNAIQSNHEFYVAIVDEYGDICERRKSQAKQIVIPFGEAIEIAFIEIPSGQFAMGGPLAELGQRANEQPQHEVAISSFLMGKFTVTQTQWVAVMGSLPPMDAPFCGADLPVVNVSWPEVDRFCKRLAEMTGFAIRLPSEAEWEYACRAGTDTPFHWGATISAQVANYNAEQSYGFARKGAASHGLTAVGSFGVANAFGLYDMHGNVWEWCADAWQEDYQDAPTDGRPWLSDSSEGYRVQRGGSWRDWPQFCRSAFRVGDIAFNRDHIVGLRVCATVNEMTDDQSKETNQTQ